jgi:hypothetical protein
VWVRSIREVAALTAASTWRIAVHLTIPVYSSATDFVLDVVADTLRADRETPLHLALYVSGFVQDGNRSIVYIRPMLIRREALADFAAVSLFTVAKENLIVWTSASAL